MMTSRERVRRLLAGQPIDRLVNGLGGHECATLHLLAYDRLKRLLGVDDPWNRMTTFMTTALVEPPVLAAMQGDIILLNSNMCAAPFWGGRARDAWREQVFWGQTFHVPSVWQFRTDADGAIWWQMGGAWSWKCPAGGVYFDEVPGTLHPEDPMTPDQYNPSHDLPDEVLRELEEGARWLYENTDYAIFAGNMVTDLQLKPGGITGWWMRLIDEPAAVHEYLAKACDAGLSQLRLLDQAVGKYAEIYGMADDMGDRRGVTIGPDLWREIYKPHYKRFFTEWHKITKMKAHLHSCGSMADIIDDLIECGVDLLNPVQISARGMEPENLIERFGGRIIFYGGAFDAVQTPPSTPPEVVYETVKRNIETLSRGPYVFAGVHNIPGDTPEEHLRAILAAYEDCKWNVASPASSERRLS